MLGLLIYARRFALDNVNFVLLMLFLSMHLLGARYLYTNVPYDRWTAQLFGSPLSSWFGWERNHFDRLTHFAYGLCLVRLFQTTLVSRLRLSERAAGWFAVEWVLASSALYELFEWLIAATLSPAAAEGYNGQQGDMWDAQKDMALATLGAAMMQWMIHMKWITSSSAAPIIKYPQ
ncbi:DUF2238 domain-containing protein [Chitinivorax sp. B]|uniref:DUF2238 domain-containing protein n=1 Tax=Chitinivorax sp. B TaxID=2502235 RepID=UPI001484D108|nr:DUF2238 domain-containing protein [Chitinivorax sp. B]